MYYLRGFFRNNVDFFNNLTMLFSMVINIIMAPTLKKLMGHIAFGACVGGCVRACVGGSHFLYLL